MKELTLQYALNPEDPKLNFDMGYAYHSIGHLASAFSHYLRCAERSTDDKLAYEALLRGYFCYESQGNREFTAVHLIKQAIALLPKRPEAYYLLAVHNSRRNLWAESYIQTSLALDFCDFDCEPLLTFIGYHGKYAMLYEKSKAAWQWDKNSECREILHTLVTEYWDKIDNEDYKKDIEKDYSVYGATPYSQVHYRYNKSNYEKFKFKFDGLDNVEENNSQVYQDLFTLFMTNGKRNGTYLEVGAGDPMYGNNTYLLEKDFDWYGVSVEKDPKYAYKFHKERKNVVLFDDALKMNFKKILDERFESKTIDYLQLDLEPARHTFECLLSLPLDEYKFGVITYEHDYYVDTSKSYREKSRRYLQMHGYELVVSDISPDGVSTFEDWWVHPDLINKETVDRIKSIEGIKNIQSFIFE